MAKVSFCFMLYVTAKYLFGSRQVFVLNKTNMSININMSSIDLQGSYLIFKNLVFWSMLTVNPAKTRNISGLITLSS